MKTVVERTKSIAVAAISIPIIGCAAGQYQEALMNLRRTAYDDAVTIAKGGAKYSAQHGDDRMVSASLDYIRQNMKDPDSTNFRNVFIREFAGGRVVCGEVNAKNSYGAYVGFRKFVANPENVTMFNTGQGGAPDIDAASNVGVVAACG